MTQPVLTLLGKDVSQYVTSWGKLEVVRKLKLSDSSLFASSFSINLDNTRGAFLPGGSRSMLPRVGWAGSPISIDRGSLSLYEGFLYDLTADDEARTVTLEMTTSLSKAADVVSALSQNGLNPARACFALLVQAGLEDLLDRASFSVAAGSFGAHTVNVVCPSDQGSTCLSLASEIADLCSLDFTLTRGRVYCVAHRLWDGSGLRQEVNGNNARSFMPMTSDASNFANQVNFSYASGSVVTLDNVLSQRAERRTISTAVDATTQSKVQVASLATARFLGRLLLSRISPRHQILPVTLGPDFPEVLPGWRFPVTYAGLALDAAPFEVAEAQTDLDADSTDVTLQRLEAA